VRIADTRILLDRAPVADKLEITLSLLIERADMIFRQAMAAGQFNAAISALTCSSVALHIITQERFKPSDPA
jgi:hypothetical protein